jgi:hypothetical protein
MRPNSSLRWLILTPAIIFAFWPKTVAAEPLPGLNTDYYTIDVVPPVRSDGEYPLCGSEVENNINRSYDGEPYEDCTDDLFMVHMSGFITIPEHSTIEFWLASDDGGEITIGDNTFGTWTDQGCSATLSGNLELEAGSQPLDLWMYENGGASCLMLAWKIDDEGWAIVPDEAFTRNEIPVSTTTLPATTTTEQTTTTVEETTTTVEETTTTVEPTTTTVEETTTTVEETTTTVEETTTTTEQTTTTTTTTTTVYVTPATTTSTTVYVEPATTTTTEPEPEEETTTTTEPAEEELPPPDTTLPEPEEDEPYETTPETLPLDDPETPQPETSTPETESTTEEADPIEEIEEETSPITIPDTEELDTATSEELIELFTELTEEQVQEAVADILEEEPTQEQAVALATSPEVLATISEEQAETIFETLDVAALNEEQTTELIAAVQDAPTEVREAFENKVDIFKNALDTYVPTGSKVPVGERRALIAIGAALTTAAATRIRQ